ncbi:MAG: hypothetical protein K2N82_08600 [Lachnospiraceae bacterium]|nr:hypothetical protein [Lachnospiraceae bacterium]
MTKDANLYGTKLIPVPAPKFLIFYNGKAPYPERQELRLSASFNVPDEEPSLELRATLLNINPGYNEDLKRACKALNDYSVYTARVRLYAETMKLEDAVNRAINECIREGILTEFLSRNKAEAMKMSIYEYDEEKHMRQTREEGYEDGYDNGYDDGLAAGHESGYKDGLATGHESGYKDGLATGIKALIQACQDLHLSKQEADKIIRERFALSDEEAHKLIQKCVISDER